MLPYIFWTTQATSSSMCKTPLFLLKFGRSSGAGVQCLSNANPSQLQYRPCACDRASAVSSGSYINSSRSMAKSSGNRDSGHRREGVCGILALLYLVSLLTNWQGGPPREGVCGILALLYLVSLLTNWQGGPPRGRGVPDYPWVGNNEAWKDFDDALAMPSGDLHLRISPNIDPEGQYNVPLVDQLPAIQDPLENIDDNAAAAEADLRMWLAVAEVASLPRQIERDEANMMVRHPQVPSSVAESGVSPSSLVDDVAARAPQHLPQQAPVPETEPFLADAPAPEVGEIRAGILPQRTEAQVEVAIEAAPPGMLELILDDPRLHQFATASMAVPSGDLESNLEERTPVDHPEAGDSSADLQAKINIQGDVENLEVGEPHAEGMQ